MARFYWKIVQCDYATTDFNRYLNHTWDKYSLNVGFSDCTTIPVNMKMFKAFGDILKQKNYWFHEKYVKRYENDLNRDRKIDLNENFNNENVFNDNDMEQFGHEHEGQNPDYIENISFADFDHNQLIACFLLELRIKIW